MKKIYMLNNSQGVIGLFLGLKSRITRTKPVLSMLALLMVCLFGVNESAWGYTTTMTSNGLAKDGPTSKTENNVTFTIGGGFLSNKTSDYYFIYSGDAGNVSWSSTGYHVCVTGISLYAKNAYSTEIVNEGSWYWPKLVTYYYPGSGYIYTTFSGNGSKVKVCSSKDYPGTSYSFSTTSHSSLFRTTGLTDVEKIYLYAESEEFHIQSFTITYTTTAKSYTINTWCDLQLCDGKFNEDSD